MAWQCQKVNVDQRSVYSLAAMMRVMTRLDPDDIDGLHAQYQSLHTRINGSPPFIKPGDEIIQPLVQIRCQVCQRGVIGSVKVEDARARGGGVVYVLETQRRVGTGRDMQIVPVVLAALAGVDVRRETWRSPDAAHVDCRVHGTLTVFPKAAMESARRVVAKRIRGREPKAERIYV